MNEMTNEEVRRRLGIPSSVHEVLQLVRLWKQAGFSQRQVYDFLINLMLDLRKEGKETEEDAIADVLDYVSGFCSPSQWIWDTPLND
jgi:hypothetical protein